MTGRRSLGLVIGLLLMAAAAGVFWLRQQQQEAAETVRRTLEQVEGELARTPLDRSALGDVLRRLRELPDADQLRLVTRARARIRLAQDRLVEAWELLGPLAQAVEPDPEDLWLGARILTRRNALNGDRGDARLAQGLAERHYQLTGEPASLLLAWQAAHRAGDTAEERRLASQLVDRAPGTLQAELVTSWYVFLDEDGHERITMSDLRDMEISFGQSPGGEVPLELEILLAVGLLRTEEEQDLREAVDRLSFLLPNYQAVVDLRDYAAVADQVRGDVGSRNNHLDWLLENAPQDHPRRALWQQLRRIR